VWPYEDPKHREHVWAAMASDPDLQRLRPAPGLLVGQETEIYISAPFMRPLGGDQALGSIYERVPIIAHRILAR